MDRGNLVIGYYLVTIIVCTLLCFLGIALRLCNVIYISWFWIFSLIWMPPLICTAIICFIFGYTALKGAFKKKSYITRNVID